MKAAEVTAWGDAPQYSTVPDPVLPDPSSGQIQIKVQAAALHQVVRARALGKHYSAKTLPHIPGTDGCGVTSEGQAVYFNSMAVGGASFAERVNVPKEQVFPLPQGLDPIKAAAFANPALSSWMGLKYRTVDLPKNFTALIVGASSTSGILAISVARHFGAGKVYGAARSLSKLEGLDLDKAFALDEYKDLGDVDVILDYVYGDAVSALFEALPSGRPIQYVQIGALGGTAALIDGGLLRSKNITVRGAGPGAYDLRSIKDEMPDILVAVNKSSSTAYETHKLSEVTAAWNKRSGDRIVIIP
ncbi:hypothetical protein DV736_g5831, partial [Chaetothyriales sp. CBS 134916]